MEEQEGTMVSDLYLGGGGISRDGKELVEIELLPGGCQIEDEHFVLDVQAKNSSCLEEVRMLSHDTIMYQQWTDASRASALDFNCNNICLSTKPTKLLSQFIPRSLTTRIIPSVTSNSPSAPSARRLGAEKKKSALIQLCHDEDTSKEESKHSIFQPEGGVHIY